MAYINFYTYRKMLKMEPQHPGEKSWNTKKRVYQNIGITKCLTYRNMEQSLIHDVNFQNSQIDIV